MLKVHAFVTGTIDEEIEVVTVGEELPMCSLTLAVESFRRVAGGTKAPARRLTLKVTGEQAKNCGEQLRPGSSVGVAVALSGRRQTDVPEGVALAVYFVGPNSRVAPIA